MKRYQKIELLWQLSSTFATNVLKLNELTGVLELEQLEEYRQEYTDLLRATNKLYRKFNNDAQRIKDLADDSSLRKNIR